ESLYVGNTYLSEESVQRLLISLADEYRGDAYHLLNFNCNTFTADFIQLLCNGVLPKWINMLARFVSGLPFIESVLPPQWIRPSLMYEIDMDITDDDNPSAGTDGQKLESASSPAELNRKGSTNGTRIRLIHAASDELPKEFCNEREK
ncbi:hypothetical protein PHET_09638, partial [Paragonimus heterotremus]